MNKNWCSKHSQYAHNCTECAVTPVVFSRRLTVLEWAEERYENTLRLAAEKTGSDRDGWLEDAAYWHRIVEMIEAYWRGVSQ